MWSDLIKLFTAPDINWATSREKPVFGGFQDPGWIQISLCSYCAVTETFLRLRVLDIETKNTILFNKQRTTKDAYQRAHACLFALLFSICVMLRENLSSGFPPGATQTRLYNHRRWLEAWNFGFRKKRDCTIYVAKTKVVISCAVNRAADPRLCFRICKKQVFSYAAHFTWDLFKKNCKILLFFSSQWNYEVSFTLKWTQPNFCGQTDQVVYRFRCNFVK